MAKGSNTTRSSGANVRSSTANGTDNYRMMSIDEFRKDSSRQNITDAEANIIYNKDIGYISPSYNDFADAFFSDNMGKFQITADTLDKVIEKNKLARNTLVYRGDEAFNLSRKWGVNASTSPMAAVANLNSMKGKTYKEHSFLSTSAVEGKNVMDSRFRVEIQIPKGFHAFISRNEKESEVILPRNTQYRMEGARQEGRKIIVTYRVIK